MHFTKTLPFLSIMGDDKVDEEGVERPKEGEQPPKDPEFDFDQWALDLGLNRKTTGILRQQELCTRQVLVMLTESDLRELGLVLGQRKLLQSAIQAFRSTDQHQQAAATTLDQAFIEDIAGQQRAPPLAPNSATSCTDSNAQPCRPRETAPASAPAVTTCTDNSAQPGQPTIADLRRQAMNDDQLCGTGTLLDNMLSGQGHVNNVYPKNLPTSQTNFEFDPRTVLTIKATRQKAVHITQFLSESTKKRRQARKKQFVVNHNDGDQLVFRTEDDHPYSGLSIEEWGAANCRLMSHLIQIGQLRAPDLDYYLAYTVQIYEYAQKYDWESILDFDFQYRERQAEHGFVWGSNSSNMELGLLQLKRTPYHYQQPKGAQHRYNGNSSSNSATRHHRADRNRQPALRAQRDELCREFVNNNGNCPYGDQCIYKHPSPISQPPKNL